MNVDVLTGYFQSYGALAIFVIVLLEYMSLPGFPAGIIMPLAGIWAASGGISFPVTILISVAAGLLGSWILYFIGKWGGMVFLKAFTKKFPKQEAAINRHVEMIHSKGCAGIFISKLIPMVRTLISIPAGVLKLNFMKYTISSALGILIWNIVFVGAGYLFGDKILTILS